MPFGPFSLDPLSFFFGFVVATIFWWIVSRVRPLLKEMGEGAKARQEESRSRHSTNLEQSHRRITLRRAQGMHLAAPLFALDEILQEPRLLAPPARVEPGAVNLVEDVVTQTLPYMPAWPELASVYNAPTLSLGEALAGGMNLVLIAHPGGGKTVALAYLATLAANRSESLGPLKDHVPFLLHVADLKLPAATAKDVLDRLTELTSETASMLDLGRVSGFVQDTFRSGRALLLLDGFDELTADGQKEVSEALRLLLTEYPRVRVVTTGAPEYVDGLLSLRFAPLTVAAWTRQRQASFTQRWGILWSQYIALEAALQSGPQQVDPILLNSWLSSQTQFLTPLELTLTVWAAYAGDTLGPHVREAISAHIRRLAPANTPLAALETLAMQSTLECQPIFDPRKARDWVRAFELPEDAASPVEEATSEQPEPAEEKPSAKKDKKRTKSVSAPSLGLLGRLASTGLLASYPGNKMRFSHPIFGGFLAGRALSAFKAEEKLLNQTDWTGKVLAMHYLAVCGDATNMVKALLDWSRLPMQRPMLAAARWLRDAPRTAPWRGKVMAALADLLQTEGLPISLRAQALAAFVLSSDPGVPALFRQLTNTLSFELMRLLALGCGAVADTKAVKILEGILEAPSISARRAACLALTAIGSPIALEAVARTLLSGDEDLRRAAAEALANDAREGHPMLRDGVTMNDILLRRAIVYGLARVHESWAVELLEKMRVEDDQWVVRNSASEVLEAKSMTNDPRIPRALKPPSDTPWVIEFAGTQGVGVSPGAPATDLLLTALKSGKPEQRLAALSYVKSKPTDGIVRQIYGAMYSDDAELREAAFLTLWEIGCSGYKLPHPSQFGFS
jgi:HEAT repeat protein